MRLTCPRCAAQYQIPDAAIPAAGREVECSACGHVWHQEGLAKSASEPAAAPAPGFEPQARPVLNRALDESVLSILREEAAREMRVRNGEPAVPAADHIPATEPQTAQPETPPAPQIDWPATTVTVSEPAASAPMLAPPPARADVQPEPDVPPEPKAQPEPDPEPEIPDWPEMPPPSLPDAAELAATLTRPVLLPEPSPAPSLELEAARTTLRPAQTEAPAAALPGPSLAAAALPAPVMPRPQQRSGYASGFGLAAMLALGLVAVYALAPQIPPGKGGTLLAEWRQGMDRGRLWLHDRILGD